MPRIGDESVASYASDAITDEAGDSILDEGLGTGTVCYGHDTGVEEENSEDFLEKISAGSNYRVSGVGDSEKVELGAGGYFELETWNFGSMLCELSRDKYGSGSGSIVLKYKNGDSEANCDLDSWNVYSTPFACTGWVKVRVEEV